MRGVRRATSLARGVPRLDLRSLRHRTVARGTWMTATLICMCTGPSVPVPGGVGDGVFTRASARVCGAHHNSDWRMAVTP